MSMNIAMPFLKNIYLAWVISYLKSHFHYHFGLVHISPPEQLKNEPLFRIKTIAAQWAACEPLFKPFFWAAPPQMNLKPKMVSKMYMYITIPFQKYMICLGYLRYEIWPLLTFDDLSRPQMTLNSKKVFKMLCYGIIPFQRYITCLGYLISKIWPLLTFNDLSRPQMTFNS